MRGPADGKRLMKCNRIRIELRRSHATRPNVRVKRPDHTVGATYGVAPFRIVACGELNES